MLAGTGGLDGGVEGQEVGLLGDVVDHLDDVADLGRALAEALDDPHHLVHDLVDPLHALDGLGDGLAAVVRDARGPGCGHVGALDVLGDLGDARRHLLDAGRGLADHGRQRVGVARDLGDRGGHLADGARGGLDVLFEGLGVARHLLDAGGHLAHGAGGLVGGGGLDLGGLAQRGGPRVDQLGARSHRAGGPPDLGDDPAQLGQHHVEGVHQIPHAVLVPLLNALRQLAPGHALGGGDQALERDGDAAGDPGGEQGAQHEAEGTQHAQAHDQAVGELAGGGGRVVALLAHRHLQVVDGGVEVAEQLGHDGLLDADDRRKLAPLAQAALLLELDFGRLAGPVDPGDGGGVGGAR
ncbi:hypothetical protein D3C86_1300880 [compost metagenome]